MAKDVYFGGASSEIEILEFKAGGNSYGVDVSQIKEILPYDKNTTPVPNSHPFIEGIIMPRDFLIPVINFLDSLKLNDVDENKQEMLIVTSINDLNIAFHVDSVNGIHRVPTLDITAPGEKLTTSQTDAISGTLLRDDRNIELVDFRKVISSINPAVNVG